MKGVKGLKIMKKTMMGAVREAQAPGGMVALPVEAGVT